MTQLRDLTLVTGATGLQGGAAARALLSAGQAVRILVRNPDAPAARALAELGAEIARGDLDDPASLLQAARGATAVFSVQGTDKKGTDSERQHGFAIVEAARKAGVRHLVHTSVCEAGRHTEFPRWASGYWSQKYWNDKWDVEQAVRQAGFERWTVLRPAFMMDNFAMPKAKWMFPHLKQGRIVTALKPETRLQMIAGDDVGAYASAAIGDPERFNRRNIDLAAEALTMSEVAATLGRVLQRQVRAESVSPEEALAARLAPGWVRNHEWVNEIGYRADIAALRKDGIPLTSFASWAEHHAAAIIVDP